MDTSKLSIGQIVQFWSRPGELITGKVSEIDTMRVVVKTPVGESYYPLASTLMIPGIFPGPFPFTT